MYLKNRTFHHFNDIVRFGEEHGLIIKNQQSKLLGEIDQGGLYRFIGEDISSNEIMRLFSRDLHVEFCLSLPARLSRGNNKVANEGWNDEKIVRSVFELPSINSNHSSLTLLV